MSQNKTLEKHEWKKQTPNKEGLWLRQCAAKGTTQLHTIAKYTYDDGTHSLVMVWGWMGENCLVSLDSREMKRKTSHFYWMGPFQLPPDSNRTLQVRMRNTNFPNG